MFLFRLPVVLVHPNARQEGIICSFKPFLTKPS